MKKINFFPKSEEAEVLVPQPRPAKEYTPAWFKNLKAFENNCFSPNLDGTPNGTAKLCVPFSDSFNMGYIQETWCDIFIKKENGVIKYYYSAKPQILDVREKSSLPQDDSFYPHEFVWRMQWIPQLPKGYSMLYTHPINRYDLPFLSLSGIVDSDKYKYETDASHPFFIKNNFSGMIPKGTPFVQMVPFKRDCWQSNFLNFDYKKQLMAYLSHQKFWGGYKKMFWTKKVFK